MLPQQNEQLSDGPQNVATPEKQGYSIVIKVDADGGLSVGVETAAQEQAENPGSESGESTYRPAADVKDALTQALAIYKADGQATADAQFDAGFSGQEGA